METISPPLSVEVLLTHADWVKALAFTLVKDPERAEDVAQETWLNALEHPPRDARNVRGWLATIVRNVVHQSGRAESRRARREEAAARTEAVADTADLVEQATRQREIVGHVLALDEPYRTTVLLRFFEGLDARAIAAHQGVPLDTVRTRLQRALARLRERLDREWGDRSSWCAALLPLARLHTKTVAASASVSTASGIVALAWKLVLVIAIAGGAWWLWKDHAARDDHHELASAGAASALDAEAPPSLPPSAGGTTPTERTSVASAPTAGAAATGSTSALGTTHIEGRVVDPTGRPVAGVQLVGKDDNLPRRLDESMRTGRPDIHPSQEALANLRQSPEALDRFAREMGDPPGLRELIRGDVLEARTVTASNGAFQLEVPGQEADLKCMDDAWMLVCDGRLSGTGERIYVVAPTISVGGVVVDKSSSALGEVQLDVAVRYESLPDFPLVLEEVHNGMDTDTRTGSDGRFLFQRAPNVKSSRIRAQLPGFESAAHPVPDHPTDDLVIVLEPEVQRCLPYIRGLVVDDHGIPVEAAEVRFGQDDSTTDERGRFEILVTSGVRPGTALTATKIGHAAAVVEAFGEQMSGHASGVEGVVLRLGGPPLTIEGRVLDTQGRPCVGWQIDLEDPTPAGTSNLSVEKVTTGQFMNVEPPRTDSKGSFRLGGLRDRSYRVRAWDEASCMVLVSQPTAAGTGGLEIRVPPDAVRPSVRGRVVSRRRAPVPGAEVSVAFIEFRIPGGESFRQCRTTRTDSSGRFEFLDAPRRHVFLRVGGSGIEDPDQHEIPDQDSAEVELEVTVMCHFRIAPRPDDPADHFQILDSRGSGLRVDAKRPHVTSMYEFVPRFEEGFPVCDVSEEASTLVLFKGKQELRRVPLSLHPGELQIVTP